MAWRRAGFRIFGAIGSAGWRVASWFSPPPVPERGDFRWWKVELVFRAQAPEADELFTHLSESEILCGDQPWCVRDHMSSMTDITEELEEAT